MPAFTPRIRSVRRSEFPAIFDLLDTCFATTDRALFERQTLNDSTFRLADGVVAEDPDGRPVSFVRIFRRRMLLRGIEVEAGGIGSVATHPEWRQRSLANGVLQECIRRMERRNVALSFLYTGIVEFYERLGWRVVSIPLLTVLAEEAAELPSGPYHVRPFTSADLRTIRRIYENDIRGRTGAVVRSPRYWTDHMTWSDDAPEGFLVACHDSRPVAYLRSHGRVPAIQYVLEACTEPDHRGAMASLLGELGRRGCSASYKLVGGILPEDSAAAPVMAALPSHRRLYDVRVPDMMRLISARAALAALLPSLAEAAASTPGPTVRARIGDAVLVLDRDGARLEDGAEQPADAHLRFDPFDAVLFLVGQREAGECLSDASGAVDDALDRLNGVLPLTPLHFWNTDRI